MTNDIKMIPVKPDLESLYGITREIQQIYDIIINNGELSYKLMMEVGLTDTDISNLLRRGAIRKDPNIDRRYYLAYKNNLAIYRTLIRSNPAITCSSFIEKYMLQLVAIYEILMARKPLNDETLENAHIDSATIKLFIENGIIKKTEKEYEIVDFYMFITYGNYLNSIGMTDKAIECHEICRRLDKNNSVFNSIGRALLRSNYRLALNKLAILDVPFQSCYKKDRNFYLYILCFLTTLPLEENKYVRALKLEDILSEEETPSIPNDIRKLAFKKKFSSAIKNIATQSEENGSISSELARMNMFLESVHEDQKKWKQRVVEYIKSGNISELTTLLSNENTKRRLEVPFNYFFEISKEILRMRKNRHPISCPPKGATRTLQEYLTSKDYMSAYCQCMVDGVNKDIPDEKNYMLMLLQVMMKEHIIYKGSTAFIEREIAFFLKHDKRIATKILEYYLKLKERYAYFPYLRLLIKVCILTEDKEFELVNNALGKVTMWYYLFPYKKYLDLASKAIKWNYIELASTYFEIITEMLKVQPNSDIIPELNRLKSLLDGGSQEPKPFSIRPI